MQIWSHAQKFFIWISEKWKVKDVVQFIVDTMYEESMVQEMNDQEGKRKILSNRSVSISL